MKKTLILIFIISNIHTSFSQTNWRQDSVVQNNNYKFALEYLENNDTINGIRYLFFTYKHGKNTELGKKTKKRLDSLVEIKKAELLKNIRGKWELKKTGSNWGFSNVNENSDTKNILIISSDSITYYKKNVKSKTLNKLKSEKINFTDICYNCEESMFYFLFSDNQIWIIKPNRNILNFKNDGYFKDDGGRTRISCGNSEASYERIE